MSNNPQNNKNNASNNASRPESRGDFDVNLIPEEVTGLVTTKNRLLKLAGVAAFWIFILGILYALLVFFQIRNINKAAELEINLSAVESKILSYQDFRREFEKFSSRLSEASKLSSQRFQWSGLFDFLEQHTLTDVFYTNLAAEKEGGLILAARARNLETAARQFMIFEQADDFISKVLVSNMTQVEEEKGKKWVEFEIHLEILPRVFTAPTYAGE